MNKLAIEVPSAATEALLHFRLFFSVKINRDAKRKNSEPQSTAKVYNKLGPRFYDYAKLRLLGNLSAKKHNLFLAKYLQISYNSINHQISSTKKESKHPIGYWIRFFRLHMQILSHLDI